MMIELKLRILVVKSNLVTLMRILVINPNSTTSMTEKIANAARNVAHSDTEIIPITSSQAPPSIQGYYDVAMCLSGLINEVHRAENFDAIVVACFDDTGIDAIRCIVEVPVLGIGEAAYHAAAMLANRFSVITTLSRSVAGIEANLMRYGLMAKCAKVRATDIPVLKLEENDRETIALIEQSIKTAIENDSAEAIVLGCAGMTDLMDQLTEKFKIPIIDGVSCATNFAEALVKSGLKTSKILTYATP